MRKGGMVMYGVCDVGGGEGGGMVTNGVRDGDDGACKGGRDGDEW